MSMHIYGSPKGWGSKLMMLCVCVHVMKELLCIQEVYLMYNNYTLD
jgi:hypothetical protein